jgi:hypothetical protein
VSAVFKIVVKGTPHVVEKVYKRWPELKEYNCQR